MAFGHEAQGQFSHTVANLDLKIEIYVSFYYHENIIPKLDQLYASKDNIRNP